MIQVLARRARRSMQWKLEFSCCIRTALYFEIRIDDVDENVLGFVSFILEKSYNYDFQEPVSF